MKRRFFGRYFKAAHRFWRDEDGIVLPYVTIMLIAIIGLSGLALDASRFRSLKTQMQAGADALALAGARELDGSSGAIGRACNAINNMISNTPEGMGEQSKIAAATITFYSSLYADTVPTTGAASEMGNVVYTAAGDCSDAKTAASMASKYVGVTVSPATLDPILVNFPMSTNAMAVAGYDFAVCNMPPVFICNPYEKTGDTNETASNRWSTQVSIPANQRQMMKLTVNGGSGYGPGHFGFLMPPDNCNGASCLRDWIATYKPKACYRKKNVDLNTGQMQSVFDAFNVRFDMYSGSLKASTNYAPAVNVRKGYTYKGNACNAAVVNASNAIVPEFQATGTLKKNNTTITAVSSTSSVIDGMPIKLDGNIPGGTLVVSHTSNSITISAKPSADATGATITIGGSGQQAAGLPRDINMIYNSSLQFGNGNWDCSDYWKTVHGAASLPTDIALGGGHCGTGTDTTVSRFQIYQYEISQSLVSDLSGPLAPSDPNGESGAPACNPPGISNDDGGGDRRTIYAAIINCGANSGLMNQGGQTADDIPVAGFGKFFMTEPADSSNQALYGEMTGAVGLDKNAKNNVQLYR